MVTEIKHEFTGVFIPAHIWLSKELIPAEKMILGEIDALSKKTGWSNASRNHYAEWLSCSLPNVTYYFEKLEMLGFIEIVKTPGFRSKTRIVPSRFYEKQVVSPIDGGSQSGLLLPVSPIDGGSQSGLPEIKDKYKLKEKGKWKTHEGKKTPPPDYAEVERLAVEAKKEKAPPVAPPPLTIHSGFNDVFDTLYEKDENGEYRPRKDSEPKQPEEFEIEVFEPVKRERVTVPKPKKDDPYVTPQKATGHKIICETADEANDLITAWTACNIATVENWYNRSKRVISAVDLQNIITKFCGNYANHWDSGKRLRFLADPVLFFRNQCSGWLIDQNKFDREQAAKAAQPRAGFNQPTETKHTAPVSTAPVAKLYHK